MAYQGPLLIKNANVRLALATGTFTAYSCQVKTAKLVPSPGDQKDYRTLCASGFYSQFTPTTWALELEGAQSWDTTGGLARFLFDNDGALIRFQVDGYGETHVPSAAEPGMAGTCRAVAVEYGGAVDEYAEFTVSMPVQGAPVLATAVFPVSLEADEDAAQDAAHAPTSSPITEQVAV
jgi:hypothetical protein